MKDALGDRIKNQYEDRTRFMLPRRTYTILRCDGKAFHTLTRGCNKPYDHGLADAMNRAATALCEEAQGSCFAYIQSDEISVLLQDFATPTTDAWFDGNVQKIVSVAAAVVSESFSREFERTAHFDARVFTIADRVEVSNYFIWRQKDAERNSLSMLCQSHFSHKELQGKGRTAQHEMLHDKNINWDALPTEQKRGRVVEYMGQWEPNPNIPVFTADRKWLYDRIPEMWP